MTKFIKSFPIKSKVQESAQSIGLIHFFEPSEGWGYIKSEGRGLIFFDATAFRGQMPTNPQLGLRVEFQLAPVSSFPQAIYIRCANR